MGLGILDDDELRLNIFMDVLLRDLIMFYGRFQSMKTVGRLIINVLCTNLVQYHGLCTNLVQYHGILYEVHENCWAFDYKWWADILTCRVCTPTLKARRYY